MFVNTYLHSPSTDFLQIWQKDCGRGMGVIAIEKCLNITVFQRDFGKNMHSTNHNPGFNWLMKLFFRTFVFTYAKSRPSSYTGRYLIQFVLCSDWFSNWFVAVSIYKLYSGSKFFSTQ